MAFGDNGLYLLSVSKTGKRPDSQLRQLDNAGRLHLRDSFPGRQAEGMAVDADESAAMVVFDGGGKSPSSWSWSLLR